MANDDLRELLAELKSETLENVVLHAIERGRTQGYQTGWHVGYLQACDEAEWKAEAARANASR